MSDASPEELEADRPLMEAWIQHEVALGGRLHRRSEDDAVIVYGHRCNHGRNLGLTLITCGLWLPVWLTLALTLKERLKGRRIGAGGKVWEWDAPFDR